MSNNPTKSEGKGGMDRMADRFLASDKNLWMIKSLFEAWAVFFSILCIGMGFYCFANQVPIVGYVFAIGMPLLNWMAYQLLKFLLWLAYDVKMIRNKLYDMPESRALAFMSDLPPIFDPEDEQTHEASGVADGATNSTNLAVSDSTTQGGMMMKVFGVITLIAGMICGGYGVSMNNDMERQMESLFDNGTTNPGSMFIVIGIGVAVIGLILVIKGIVDRNKR